MESVPVKYIFKQYIIKDIFVSDFTGIQANEIK